MHGSWQPNAPYILTGGAGLRRTRLGGGGGGGGGGGSVGLENALQSSDSGCCLGVKASQTQTHLEEDLQPNLARCSHQVHEILVGEHSCNEEDGIGPAGASLEELIGLHTETPLSLKSCHQ